ncbi:hypothetical protein TTHERM_00371130 (macronuclear) [Tetrahymena thermophila SB210]|uniref:Uncharacterized protein n=1 Tax=Tetrahymena thermophila (strain SB210) TaxID=312017 RepID=I7M735_TETTS|nr:hypothetical protein TTHERM_00371130 [Tetrahymena thermophila SB210]EAR89298.1 hypothetical protein TTHERM_00371130 [Tetrahymena thermophila SB210]|eukprot:XP_001009543.1 hypothetical protein TTHERM_00371130 [Tetrahymena thermophila SB210]
MSFSGPLMSEDLKKVQEQLAQIMKQTSKQKAKKTDDFSESRSQDYQNNEEDQTEQKYKQMISNSQNIPDVGLVDQTSDLMQNIIKVMKDQDLNNQLQILTDQEISKPITGFDLKNVINRMHQGISAEQQRIQGARNSNADSRNISMCQSSILNKSANFGKSKSKSPALSSRTKAIINKKQKNGEYKPIYKRLDEIKQRHEETIMRTKGMYPKVEEPIPSFHPQIKEHKFKIMQHKNRQQQNWDEFLKEMKDWDEKKISQIKQRQAEKEMKTKEIHTFRPVINRSTQNILEKSPSLKNDYDPQNMQNVVSRLYSRMKEKKQREEQRLKESFSNSPFRPKINQNSEKLFFKMCNGIKVPLEERMKQRTPIKNIIDTTPRNLTPQQGKVPNTLDPIKEVQQSNNQVPSFKNQGEQLNKSLQLQNSIISNKTLTKEGFLQNSSGLNQSIHIQKNISNNTNQLSLSNCSFLNNNNNGNLTNTSNINNITIQTPENKKSNGLNTSKSIILSKNKEKNPNNKSILGLSTKATNDTQKENNYHILITDGNQSSQEDLQINRSSIVKIKPSNSPQRASTSQIEQNRLAASNQKQNQQNLSLQNSTSNLVNSNKLSQSINLLNQKSAQKQEEQTSSPQKANVNLTYNIRSPKLNHSPLKKSALNYTMTVQNIKAQTNKLSSASKFEVLNTQISPLKDLDNQNDIEYGQNLKYIINLLKKEDPSFSQQKNSIMQSQHQNSQSSLQIQNKIQKSPQKKK